jgi:Domain of unknown function (DUF4159)
MCDHCHFPAKETLSRRSFVRKIAGAAGAVGLLGATRARAQEDAPPIENAGWARLITATPYWAFHRENDPLVVNFIREKAQLEIGSPSLVEASQLDQLCASRFLFSNNLTAVRDPRELLNLREYLYRGGFIYVDTCVRTDVTPSFGAYYRRHLELFTHLVPGSQVTLLPPEHPIFHAYFPVEKWSIPSGAHLDGDPQWAGAREALYGVFDDDRMIALLSLDHLLCGWPNSLNRRPAALRQIANIYGVALKQ